MLERFILLSLLFSIDFGVFASKYMLSNVTANAGSDQCLTVNFTIFNADTLKSGETGTWLKKVPNTAVITDTASPKSGITNLPIGKHTFIWRVITPSDTTYDEVDITVITIAIAPADVCIYDVISSSSVNLNGNKPVGSGTAYWSMIPKNPAVVIADSTMSVTTASGLIAGSVYVFRWTIANGLCNNHDDIIVRALSNANAGIDQCVTSITAQLNATPRLNNENGYWTNGPMIVNPDDPKTNISNLQSGSNIFRWNIENGICADFDDAVINKVTQPNITSGQCFSSSTITLQGNTNLLSTENGTWTGPNISTPAPSPAVVTGLPLGRFDFRYTISTPSCPNQIFQDHTVRIITNPIILGSNPICVSGNLTEVRLAGNAPSLGERGEWSTVSANTNNGTSPSLSFDTIAGTPASPIVKGLIPGSYVFRWKISRGPGTVCQRFADVTVNVITKPNAGTDACLIHPITTQLLGANKQDNNESGQWKSEPGISFGDPNSNNTIVSNLPVKRNILTWEISRGTCVLKDTVVLTVVSKSDAGANVCTTVSNSQISALLPVTRGPQETATWTNGMGQLIVTNTNTAAVSNLLQGIHKFYWTITNGSCASKDSAEVTFLQKAKINNTYCLSIPKGTSPINLNNLNANLPSGLENGKWTFVSKLDNATSFSSDGAAITNVNNLKYGTQVVRWTVSNNGCASSDSIPIYVIPKPYAGLDNCLPTSTGPLTFKLNADSILPSEQGSWSVDPIASPTVRFQAITSPTTTVTGLNLGIHVFTWKVSLGPTCFDSDTSIITVINKAIAPLVDFCNPNTKDSILLTGSAFNSTLESAVWNNVPITSNIITPAAASTKVNNLSLGENVFTYTIRHKNNMCTNTDTVKAILVTKPNAGFDRCYSRDTINSSLSGNNPVASAGEMGIWRRIGGAGTIYETTNPKSNLLGLEVGKNDFLWEISNGACILTDTVSHTYVTQPIGTDIEVCGKFATLTAKEYISSKGEIGTWSILPGTMATIPIAIIHDTIINVSNLRVNSNLFLWSIQNGLCTYHDTVKVFNNQLETVNAGTDIVTCFASVNLNANNPANEIVTAKGTWIKIKGNGQFSNINLPKTSVTLSPDTNIFVWKVSTNPNCQSLSDTVIVKQDRFTAANAGLNQRVCGSMVELKADKPKLGNGKWNIVTGGGNIDNDTINTTIVRNLPLQDTTYLQWTVVNGACTGVDNVMIITDSVPTIINAGSAISMCTDTLQLIGNNPKEEISYSNGYWKTIGKPMNAQLIFTDSTSNKSRLTLKAPGQYSLTWNIVNGVCPAISDTIIITRDQNVPTPLAGSNQTVCSSALSLKGNATAIGSSLWQVYEGNGTLSNATSPTAILNDGDFGINKLKLLFINGTCRDSSLVSINLLPPTSIAKVINTDTLLCEVNILDISAHKPTLGEGAWSIVGNATLQSDSTLNINRAILHTQILTDVDTNIFIWTTRRGACVSADTFTVQNHRKPDFVFAGKDQEVFAAEGNMFADAPAFGKGVWKIKQGMATLEDIYDAKSSYTNLAMGENIFIWTIGNHLCDSISDTVIITRKEFLIPNAFSPNFDKSNEKFVIRGIEKFPGTKLHIFNRWGNIVYSHQDYDNQWDGKNSSGAPLTDDTYYYILERPAGQSDKGFVIIKRN